MRPPEFFVENDPEISFIFHGFYDDDDDDNNNNNNNNRCWIMIKNNNWLVRIP